MELHEGPSTARIATEMLQAAITGMRSLGLNTDALLTDAGIPDPARSPDHVSVPYERIADLWDRAVNASGDEGLGLRVAATLEPDQFSMFVYLGRSGTGFRQAMGDVNHYGALLGEGVAFTLVERDGLPRLIHSLAGSPTPHPASADYALGAVVTLIRKELLSDFRPAEVHLRRRPPADTRVYEEFFGAPVRFDASENAIVFDDLTELASRAPDPTLHKILERSALQLVREQSVDNALDRRLRSVIASELCHGRPTASCLSARLGMSERTLRRRLAERSIRLSELVDEVRLGLAEQYLDSGMPVVDAARRLGFSEPSAFYRAFRRWTGTTPSQRAERAGVVH